MARWLGLDRFIVGPLAGIVVAFGRSLNTL
jgi:hypothetical protein